MSNQDVSTPAELIRAIESRFGPLTIDLAANADNHKAPIWLGPGGRVDDAFSIDWFNPIIHRQGQSAVIVKDTIAWLNNPYRDTAKWVKKCFDTVTADNAGYGWKILQLIPAAVCNNYVVNYINDYAYRIELTPRPFADEVRDCMLIVWTPEQLVGRETWEWDEQA